MDTHGYMRTWMDIDGYGYINGYGWKIYINMARYGWPDLEDIDAYRQKDMDMDKYR